MSAERLATLLLILGTAGGIALAAFGIVRSGRPAGPDGADGPDTDGAVAVVNGQPISRESFERAAASLAAQQRQDELDAAARSDLLEYLIDQELLFQRGLDLGLARHEPAARAAIVTALVTSIGASAEVGEPDEAELRRFYDENRERFAAPDRLDLEVAFVRTADGSEDARGMAYRRAEEIARRARAGEPLTRVSEELADPPEAPLPEGALSLRTLREHLGSKVLRSAMALEPGTLSDPVRGADGYYVLRLRARAPGEVPPFEEVRTRVRNEAVRTRGNQALLDYLANLRAGGDVRVLDPELGGRPESRPTRSEPQAAEVAGTADGSG